MPNLLKLFKGATKIIQDEKFKGNDDSMTT